MMKAVIMAGGFGTRLGELTTNFPKGLLPISGKTLMQHAVDDLLSVIPPRDIVLVTNTSYFNIFRKWRDQEGLSELTILDDGARDPEERRGAIGDLVYALETMCWNGDQVVAVSSDALARFHFSELIDFFEKNRGFVNVVTDIKDPGRIAGKLGAVVKDGIKMTGFIEKPLQPLTTLTSIPHYVYPAELLPYLKQYYASFRDKLPEVDQPGRIIPWLIKQGLDVYAYDISPSYYYDVGTREMYELLKVNFDPMQENGLRQPLRTSKESIRR